jgi:hypothetical protein
MDMRLRWSPLQVEGSEEAEFQLTDTEDSGQRQPVYGRQRRRHPVAAEARMLSSAPWHSGITSEEFMDAVAVVLALATFALMFGLIRAMDRI